MSLLLDGPTLHPVLEKAGCLMVMTCVLHTTKKKKDMCITCKTYHINMSCEMCKGINSIGQCIYPK